MYDYIYTTYLGDRDMELDITTVILLIFFGFLGAFLNALVGGGGLITTPTLMLVGLPPATAIATNKLAATMGNLTSTLTFLKAGKVDMKLLGPILPFVFLFSMLGAWTVHLMNPALLKPLVIIMLILVLIYSIIKKDWGQDQNIKEITWKRKLLFIAALLVIGFYDGFLGPGTGSFIIFVLLMRGFDFLQASGNAKLLNFTSNIAALTMFLILKEVLFAYGLIMGVSMVCGAYVGSKFALKKGSTFVRMVFIVTTAILIAKNSYDFFFH